jgi:hypothetical protein
MLRVMNTDIEEDREYKSGDFIIEAVGEWHKATTISAEPVKLLVIDMTERGKNNVILKKRRRSIRVLRRNRLHERPMNLIISVGSRSAI